MSAVLDVILLVLRLYTYVIIVVAIMSWLIAFNVINIYNNVVRSIWDALNAITEPVLRPIRRILPNFNGLDLSPLVLLLIIFFPAGRHRQVYLPERLLIDRLRGEVSRAFQFGSSIAAMSCGHASV